MTTLSNEVTLVLCCAQCDDILQRHYADGRIELEKSYAICEGCGLPICWEHLHAPAGMTGGPWPVHYSGYFCNKCYETDDAIPTNGDVPDSDHYEL